MSHFYFFDQPVLLERNKRHRKLPDELPRSLRFANLPTTLAAFLSSQERQKIKQDGGDGLDDLFDFDFGLNGDGNDLANLSNEAQVFRKLRRRGSDDDLSVDGEYSQKQHYHEAVSVAPTILVQLSAVLYLFKNEHLDLPQELVNSLEGNFKVLSEQVQYGTFKWQCTENILQELQDQQEAAEAEAAAAEDEEGQGKEQNGKDAEKTDGEKVSKKKRRKKLDAGGEGAGHGIAHGNGSGSKISKNGKKHHSKDGHRKISTGVKGEGSGTGDSASDTHQGAGSASIHQPNFLQIVSFSMSSKACEDKGWILQHQKRDKVKEENEQRNRLEICVEKLKEALLQIKLDNGRYRELGHDKPLYTRYYGDTKREAMQKYISKRTTTGKSPTFLSSKREIIPPKVAPVNILPGQTQLFYHSLHDGSSTAFYPSGNLAATVCKAGLRMPGHYTLIYEDNEDKDLLASFTPTGHGCIYHPNGFVKFLSTEKEGIMFDTTGTETKKWDWLLPHLKLPHTVSVSINDHFTLRCANRNQMTIVFTCHKETAKLHVGQVLTAVVPVTQEELGYLVTEEQFQSKSAEECQEPPPVSPKKEKKKSKNKVVKPQHPPAKPTFQISEIVKSLEMEEDTVYNIPAEIELSRLTRKAKNLCENWMDHYCDAVGIRSPHLSRIKSAVPHHRKRGIQSAKPMMNNVFQDEQDDTDIFLPRGTGLTRSPSAPPTSWEDRRRMSTMSAMSRHSRQRAGSPDSRLKSAASSRQNKTAHFDASVSISVPAGGWRDQPRPATSVSFKSEPVTSSETPTPHIAWNSSPNRTTAPSPTSVPNLPRRKSGQLTGCPVALRAEMLGDVIATCRCSRHKVPPIGDLELDKYLKHCVPRTQLIVIAIVSALFPEALPCHDMFSKFYDRQQRNRTKPCYQSQNDPYRLLLYDVVSAVHLSGHKQPLLYTRHNAVPGMFMIYAGARLVFCDHIFNGYGNAKRDFQKQLLHSREHASHGNFLPADFKFNPSRGRRGLRSAWGGEIGGTGVDRLASSGLPRLVINQASRPSTCNAGERRSKSPGAISPDLIMRPATIQDFRHDHVKRKKHASGDKRQVDTAVDFLSLSLHHQNNLVALTI